MSRSRAQDVRLMPHRWDMHAIQALASSDHELLARVLAELLPAGNREYVNTRVQVFGFGAPARFHTYAGSMALLEHVEDGDTLLLLAIRSCDPLSALALIRAGASLQEPNNVGESPIQQLFEIYAAMKLRERQQPSGESSPAPSSSQHPAQLAERVERAFAKQSDFKALFAYVHDALDSFYGATKESIRCELEAIYTEFAPERMPKLAKQLQDFEFNERALLDGVRCKYLSSA